MFGILSRIRRYVGERRVLKTIRPELRRRFTFRDLTGKSLSANELYGYCLFYYYQFLPKELQEHRKYFAAKGRGFGEEAFHAMWWLLFEEFRPKSALEIGVYRGQTITLWKLVSRNFGLSISVGCISPFTAAGDSVSRYRPGLDYLEDVKLNHRYFGLELPEICRGFSTEVAAKEFIAARVWDIIYIDGNHDYEIAREDWFACSGAVAQGGLIVLDDSALDTDFSPPSFSTAGHRGPSRLAREIDPRSFREIFAVGHNRVFQRIE